MSRTATCLICDASVDLTDDAASIRLSNSRRIHRACYDSLETRVTSILASIAELDKTISNLYASLHSAQIRRYDIERLVNPNLFKRFNRWLSGDPKAEQVKCNSLRRELEEIASKETIHTSALDETKSRKRNAERDIYDSRALLAKIYSRWPGDPPDWEERRQAALRHGRCQWRKLKNFALYRYVDCDGPLHVHHVKPLIEGGNHDPENLMLLCHRHHEMHHGHRIVTGVDRPPRYYDAKKIRTPITNDKETQLIEAIQQGMTIRISYTSELGIKTVRDITPTDVFRGYSGRRYVRAFCHLRQDERTFRIARIGSIEA